jgi:hypothetical protein
MSLRASTRVQGLGFRVSGLGMSLRASTGFSPSAWADHINSQTGKTSWQVQNRVGGEGGAGERGGVRVPKSSGFLAGGSLLHLRPVVHPLARLLPLAMRPSAGRCKGVALGGGAGWMWVLGRDSLHRGRDRALRRGMWVSGATVGTGTWWTVLVPSGGGISTLGGGVPMLWYSLSGGEGLLEVGVLRDSNISTFRFVPSPKP